MHKAFASFFFIALISLPAVAFAAMALVPQSGQTVCYDTAGTEIPCAGTGQDGDQQLGIPWPNPRFTDNGNGTVTDNLTGLIWLKNGNCFSSKTWNDALTAANTLASGACGLSDGSVAGDWRLPNKKELESLVNRQQVNPATWLNTAGFSGLVASWYWSASTASNSAPSYAWIYNLGSGHMSYSPKNNGYYVWPVRSGL